jgi:hypothetical protein
MTPHPLSSRLARTALAVLLAGTFVRTASAQTTAADAAHAKEAEVRFQEGLKAYDREDYERAYVVFLEAQAIYPRPSLLRNLALCELHTHRPLGALEHLRLFIAAPGTTPEMRVIAEKNLADAYSRTGHLSITAPDGAHVSVDHKEVGVAPLKEAVDVVEGPHGVEAVAGGTTLRETVDAAKGRLTEVAFVGPVVADTHVVVGGPATGPNGTVIVPSVGGPVEPEHHGYWNGRRTVGVVIAGVGAVGMVVGSVFGAQRGSETSDANTALPTIGSNGSACVAPKGAALTAACSSLSNARSSNGNDASIEGPMLVGGGVLLALGLVTAFWPSPSAPPSSGLAPMAGPHLAGLSWSGSF